VKRIVTCSLAVAVSTLIAPAASTPFDSFAPSRTPGGGARPTVFVVAVREARLLTMCADIPEVRFADGRGWRPDGRARAMLQRDGDDLQLLTILPPRRRQDEPVEETEAWARRAGIAVTLPRPARSGRESPPGLLLERVDLDRGRAVIDRPVQDAITREFRRLKRYDVVESADQADYVFLAETSYAAEAAASKGTSTYIRRDDWPLNVRQSIFAIMVTGAAYRRSPGDINALLKNRIWEGSDLMQQPYRREWENPVTEARYVDETKAYGSASPEWVVRQLHGKVRRMPGHPVLCAAYE